MKKLFFITGASGAGKTTAVKNVQKEIGPEMEFFFFDSIGVPSLDEMKIKFGGPEEWQRVSTHAWAKKIKDEVLGSKSALLDGQVRPVFIDEACEKQGISDYEVVLFDCSDEERRKRLDKRDQSELADEQMLNWAKYLRDESIVRNYRIIDNTNFTQEQTAKALIEIIKSNKFA